MPIEQLQVPEIIDMLENMIGKLDRPPIIMGHSAGGVFTQILLDHGFGAVGVAIDSAPTEGVKVVPLSEIRSGFPILKNPANRHRAVGFTPKQWHYVFANTFSEEKSLELYERYHIPASGRVFWGSALANIHPGKDDTYVDYHNDARPPLLFISGKQDGLFPPKVGHSNVKHYKSKTVTEIVEFDGPHLLPAIDGWEEVADFALDWALNHAGMTAADHAAVHDPDSANRGSTLRGSRGGGARCRVGDQVDPAPLWPLLVRVTGRGNGRDAHRDEPWNLPGPHIEPNGGATTCADRVGRMWANGLEVQPTDTFRVTMNSFLAAGGDGFTVFNQGTDPLGGAQDIDALVDYFEAAGAAGIAVPPRDRIVTPAAA